MKTIRDYFSFFYLWGLIAVSSVFLFLVALVIWFMTVCFDRRLAWLHFFTCFWGALYTWLNPFCSVEICGKEQINPKQTYIMIANHTSMMDIFSIFRLFTYFKWVAKESLFTIPFVGWNMFLNGYIKINRRGKSHKKMFGACFHHLLEHRSLFIFPEGTRSKDGCLGNFKTGAFRLALKAKTDILPITIHDSHGAFSSKAALRKRRRKIKVAVHRPLRYEQFKMWSVEVLTKKIQDEIKGFLLVGDSAFIG